MSRWGSAWGRVLRAMGALGIVVAVVAVPLGTEVATAVTTVTVSPSTNLTDGTSVAITSSSTFQGIELCLAGQAVDGPGCGIIGGGPGVSPISTVTVRLPARTLVGHGSYTVLDCRTVACDVALIDFPSEIDHTKLVEVGRAPVTFDPTAPLQPAPTISATPTTHLSDGTAVTVSVTGDPSGSVAQCAAANVPVDQIPHLCGLWDSDAVDVVAGSGTGPFTVKAFISTDQGLVDCRAAGATCTLVAFSRSLTTASTPISFDPGGYVAPAAYLNSTNFTDHTLQLTLDAVGVQPSAPFKIQLCNTHGACAPDVEASGTTTADGTIKQVTFPHPPLPANPSACHAADGGCAIAVVISGQPPLFAQPVVGWIEETPVDPTPTNTPVVYTPPSTSGNAATATAVKATPTFTG